MVYNIKITQKYGVVLTGFIDGYSFTVKWEYGKALLDDKIPLDGWKKRGLAYEMKEGITFLSLSKLNSDIGGNPMLPEMKGTLSTYCKYDNGEWKNFDSSIDIHCLDLVEYITRIKTFGLIVAKHSV